VVKTFEVLLQILKDLTLAFLANCESQAKQLAEKVKSVHFRRSASLRAGLRQQGIGPFSAILRGLKTARHE